MHSVIFFAKAPINSETLGTLVHFRYLTTPIYIDLKYIGSLGIAAHSPNVIFKMTFSFSYGLPVGVLILGID